MTSKNAHNLPQNLSGAKANLTEMTIEEAVDNNNVWAVIALPNSLGQMELAVVFVGREHQDLQAQHQPSPKRHAEKGSAKKCCPKPSSQHLAHRKVKAAAVVAIEGVVGVNRQGKFQVGKLKSKSVKQWPPCLAQARKSARKCAVKPESASVKNRSYGTWKANPTNWR